MWKSVAPFRGFCLLVIVSAVFKKVVSQRSPLYSYYEPSLHNSGFGPAPPRPREESLSEKYFNLFSASPDNNVPDRDPFRSPFARYRESLGHISEQCSKDSLYASHNPSHKRAMNSLATLYNDQRDINGMLDVSRYFKGEVHPQIWYASLMRAQLAKMPDTLSMMRPSPIHLFPSSFFPDAILRQNTPTRQECLLLDERFGENNGIENRLWYFREDVQLNAHHWIWHLLYPVNSTERIDRRGEFFSFFHHDLLARYATERLANDLDKIFPLNMDVNSIVEEGYDPHLVDGVSTLPWAARPPHQQLSVVLNDTIYEQLTNLTLQKLAVLEILLTGKVNKDNFLYPVTTYDHINILGELSEGSIHTINPLLYGMEGYHNEGHIVLANLIGNSQPGSMGPMGHNALAMRDIIFYRWHKLVDTYFVTYKATHLAPYGLREGEHPLIFDGISVGQIKVVSDGENQINILHTFFNTRRFDLEGGLDFNTQNIVRPPTVNVCAKHLDHNEFTYEINIENTRQADTLTTIRIFMAPRFKSKKEGKKRYTIAEQRNLFFAMDSFVANLKPGANLVTRSSSDSSLTTPWPKSVQQLREEIEGGVIGGAIDCDCGYPHHLLLPRGTESGMIFDLFVMATDGVADHVPAPPLTHEQQRRNIPQCTPSHIHCGIQGRNYPDAKPMGYPFDRRPYSIPVVVDNQVQNLQVSMLEDYVSQVPNMATTQIAIVHRNVQINLNEYQPPAAASDHSLNVNPLYNPNLQNTQRSNHRLHNYRYIEV